MILRARKRSRPQRLLRDRQGGSYLPMVSVLVLLFLFGPSLAGRGVIASSLTGIAELAIAVFGVLGATENPTRVRNVVLFATVASLAQFIGEQADIRALLIAGRLGVVVLLLWVQGLILSDILPEPQVTISTIVGAVGTYLLSILYWATVYAAVSAVNSSAFQGAIGPTSTMLSFLYYSSITQTTVGYGDIVPVSSFARSLASLQAIIGQLYVAILVAWLVGRAVSERGA
jgi:voltage-gated potassium channel